MAGERQRRRHPDGLDDLLVAGGSTIRRGSGGYRRRRNSRCRGLGSGSRGDEDERSCSGRRGGSRPARGLAPGGARARELLLRWGWTGEVARGEGIEGSSSWPGMQIEEERSGGCWMGMEWWMGQGRSRRGRGVVDWRRRRLDRRGSLENRVWSRNAPVIYSRWGLGYGLI